jgi:hypothetical protein
MQSVYADSVLGYEKGPFQRPIRPLSVEINCDKYQNPEFVGMDTVNIEEAIDRLDQDEIF